MTNWLHLYIQRILPSVSLSSFFVCSCVIPVHMDNTGVDGLSAVVVTQEPWRHWGVACSLCEGLAARYCPHQQVSTSLHSHQSTLIQYMYLSTCAQQPSSPPEEAVFPLEANNNQNINTFYLYTPSLYSVIKCKGNLVLQNTWGYNKQQMKCII